MIWCSNSPAKRWNFFITQVHERNDIEEQSAFEDISNWLDSRACTNMEGAKILPYTAVSVCTCIFIFAFVWFPYLSKSLADVKWNCFLLRAHTYVLYVCARMLCMCINNKISLLTEHAKKKWNMRVCVRMCVAYIHKHCIHLCAFGLIVCASYEWQSCNVAQKMAMIQCARCHVERL